MNKHFENWKRENLLDKYPKITQETINDLATFLLMGPDNFSKEKGEYLLKINQQIQELPKLQQKATLFDSLVIENQTILDTISQVKIANEMYERVNKDLRIENQDLHTALNKEANDNVNLSEIVTRLKEEMKKKREIIDSSNPPLRGKIFISQIQYNLMYNILHGDTKSLK